MCHTSPLLESDLAICWPSARFLISPLQTLEALEQDSDDESVEDSEVDSDEGEDVDFDQV